MRISPWLRMRGVPRVVKQASLSITRVLCDEQKLMNYIIDRRRVTMPHRILGIERLRHVQPIEPHLLRIDLLVPESSLFRARLRAELFTKPVSRAQGNAHRRFGHTARRARALR